MSPRHVLVLERGGEPPGDLADVLRGAGHRVLAVTRGGEAVEALREPEFDTLVVELGLPELDRAALRAALDPVAPAVPEPLDAAERRHIALMLRHTGGNKRQAALLLGISRSTLLNKIRKYHL